VPLLLLRVRILNGAIGSESRPLIDKRALVSLGSEPSHVDKAMKLNAFAVRDRCPGLVATIHQEYTISGGVKVIKDGGSVKIHIH